MAKTYGVGIMGAGNISSAYLRLAPLFKGLEVRAVADILPDAAKTRAGEFKVKAQTPDELLANPDVDVVVNLTIPVTHYKVSLEAIKAGKHVYSEKPFVLSLQEGLTLKKEADARKLKVGSAPDTFMGGAHQQVRDLIDSGKLGKIASGTAHIMSRGVEHWHPNPDFFFKPGAGPLLDMGPYYISDLVQLLGPVRRVSGITGMAHKERTISAPNSARIGQKVSVETPTTIHGILEFHSGAIVTLGASFDVLSHGHHNIELYGTEGSVFVPDPNFFGGEITTSNELGKKDVVTPWSHPFGVINEDHGLPRARANYRSAGLADMMNSIESGETARCGLDFALHVIEVMTAILKSGETGTVQMLTTAPERPKAVKPADAQAMLR
jgi:predicted dehydrogenase